MEQIEMWDDGGDRFREDVEECGFCGAPVSDEEAYYGSDMKDRDFVAHKVCYADWRDWTHEQSQDAYMGDL